LELSGAAGQDALENVADSKTLDQISRARAPENLSETSEESFLRRVQMQID
jgi:hypothetical protein